VRPHLLDNRQQSQETQGKLGNLQSLPHIRAASTALWTMTSAARDGLARLGRLVAPELAFTLAGDVGTMPPHDAAVEALHGCMPPRRTNHWPSKEC